MEEKQYIEQVKSESNLSQQSEEQIDVIEDQESLQMDPQQEKQNSNQNIEIENENEKSQNNFVTQNTENNNNTQTSQNNNNNKIQNIDNNNTNNIQKQENVKTPEQIQEELEKQQEIQQRNLLQYEYLNEIYLNNSAYLMCLTSLSEFGICKDANLLIRNSEQPKQDIININIDYFYGKQREIITQFNKKIDKLHFSSFIVLQQLLFNFKQYLKNELTHLIIFAFIYGNQPSVTEQLKNYIVENNKKEYGTLANLLQLEKNQNYHFFQGLIIQIYSMNKSFNISDKVTQNPIYQKDKQEFDTKQEQLVQISIESEEKLIRQEVEKKIQEEKDYQYKIERQKQEQIQKELKKKQEEQNLLKEQYKQQQIKQLQLQNTTSINLQKQAEITQQNVIKAENKKRQRKNKKEIDLQQQKQQKKEIPKKIQQEPIIIEDDDDDDEVNSKQIQIKKSETTKKIPFVDPTKFPSQKFLPQNSYYKYNMVDYQNHQNHMFQQGPPHPSRYPQQQYPQIVPNMFSPHPHNYIPQHPLPPNHPLLNPSIYSQELYQNQQQQDQQNTK